MNHVTPSLYAVITDPTLYSLSTVFFYTMLVLSALCATGVLILSARRIYTVTYGKRHGKHAHVKEDSFRWVTIPLVLLVMSLLFFGFSELPLKW